MDDNYTSTNPRIFRDTKKDKYKKEYIYIHHIKDYYIQIGEKHPKTDKGKETIKVGRGGNEGHI